MPNDLEATAAALKRRDHQRADPASNSPEPDAQGSGTYDNRTHRSSFRQIKKKAVQFKCGRLLANYRDLWLQLPSLMGDDQGGNRNGEVVQRDKGLWIHSAR